MKYLFGIKKDFYICTTNKQKIVEIMSTITQDQIVLMNQIIEFGRGREFDFEGMTKESLDQLMKDWLEHGRQFQVAIAETELTVIKSLMNL